MSTDLPFNIDAVISRVRDRFDVEYAIAYGSAVRNKRDYADIDIYTVCDIEYSRTFDQFYVDGELIDLVVHSPYLFTSYRDHYYWYPENLITMIGATFDRCEVLIDHERFEQIRQDIASPPTEVRFFIYTYHLGQLLQSRTKRNWNDLWVNEPWSVIAVLSAYWNQYPPGVYPREYRATLGPEQRELLNPIWTDKSFAPEITDTLIDYTIDRFTDWVEEVSVDETLEIYTRTQGRAIEAISEKYPRRSLSDYEVKPVKVG